jgi:hypothetical protein
VVVEPSVGTTRTTKRDYGLIHDCTHSDRFFL